MIVHDCADEIISLSLGNVTLTGCENRCREGPKTTDFYEDPRQVDESALLVNG